MLMRIRMRMRAGRAYRCVYTDAVHIDIEEGIDGLNQAARARAGPVRPGVSA